MKSVVPGINNEAMCVLHNVMQANPVRSHRQLHQALWQESGQSSIGRNCAQDARTAPKRQQAPKKQSRPD